MTSPFTSDCIFLLRGHAEARPALVGPRRSSTCLQSCQFTVILNPQMQHLADGFFLFFCCQHTGAEVANASEGLVILYL